MASYCESCGRGTWACGCEVPFSERIRTVQIRHVKATPRFDPDPPSALVPSDPLEYMRHDQRYPAMANLRDRMRSQNSMPKPPPMPRGEKVLGW